MKKLLLLPLLSLLLLPGCANDSPVEEAWVRAGDGDMTAAYAEISQKGELVKVKVPTRFASEAQLHETSQEEGMAMMRPAQTLKTPAELKPGGYHIMLVGLKKPLSPGQRVPLTFIFKDGSVDQVSATVR